MGKQCFLVSKGVRHIRRPPHRAIVFGSSKTAVAAAAAAAVAAAAAATPLPLAHVSVAVTAMVLCNFRWGGGDGTEHSSITFSMQGLRAKEESVCVAVLPRLYFPASASGL